MKSVDRAAAARGIAAFLEALGYDPSDSELVGTPERVTEAFATELLRGERTDLAELVQSGSSEVPAKQHGLVLVRKIAVSTVCPHHLLPAIGHADVAYQPGTRLLGLGTITRLIDACARRLTLQESIAENVVTALREHGRAAGAYCRIELLHTCLVARGSEQTEARLVTSFASGSLAGNGTNEVLQALKASGA